MCKPKLFVPQAEGRQLFRGLPKAAPVLHAVSLGRGVVDQARVLLADLIVDFLENVIIIETTEEIGPRLLSVLPAVQREAIRVI